MTESDVGIQSLVVLCTIYNCIVTLNQKRCANALLFIICYLKPHFFYYFAENTTVEARCASNIYASSPRWRTWAPYQVPICRAWQVVLCCLTTCQVLWRICLDAVFYGGKCGWYIGLTIIESSNQIKVLIISKARALKLLADY